MDLCFLLSLISDAHRILLPACEGTCPKHLKWENQIAATSVPLLLHPFCNYFVQFLCQTATFNLSCWMQALPAFVFRLAVFFPRHDCCWGLLKTSWTFRFQSRGNPFCWHRCTLRLGRGHMGRFSPLWTWFLGAVESQGFVIRDNRWFAPVLCPVRCQAVLIS